MDRTTLKVRITGERVYMGQKEIDDSISQRTVESMSGTILRDSLDNADIGRYNG